MFGGKERLIKFSHCDLPRECLICLIPPLSFQINLLTLKHSRALAEDWDADVFCLFWITWQLYSFRNIFPSASSYLELSPCTWRLYSLHVIFPAASLNLELVPIVEFLSELSFAAFEIPLKLPDRNLPSTPLCLTVLSCGWLLRMIGSPLLFSSARGALWNEGTRRFSGTQQEWMALEEHSSEPWETLERLEERCNNIFVFGGDWSREWLWLAGIDKTHQISAKLIRTRQKSVEFVRNR